MAEIKITDKEKEFLKRKQEIIIDDNECYVEIPIYPDRVKRELVMTKEVFIECYNKWIIGEDGYKTDGK